MTKLFQLSELGQSIWLDYINRRIIENGQVQKWIDQGVMGMTSNPSIFNQVISSSSDYDKSIIKLKESGATTFSIYDDLTIKDIQDAADIFKPVYVKTNATDGYVSIEINPELADNIDESIKEGKRLFEKANRQNVMIKVPATKAGFQIVEELLAMGINVNVTLIFSAEQYKGTVKAYFRGLERLAEKSADLSHVKSVASVFVSRIDTVVDKMIDEKSSLGLDSEGQTRLQQLKGRAAVANSNLIYKIYKDMFSSYRFKDLEEKGASVQRVLWGSTSTKNSQYSDIKYVSELIASPTINTVPEKTLEAFIDHGEVKESLTSDTTEAENVVSELSKYDISVDCVCNDLLNDGVASFKHAFTDLLKSIESKAKCL